MAQYMQNLLQLAEQSSSPATPPTGIGKLYFKADGNLYIKDDTGTETQITGAASNDGVDTLQWGASEISVSTVTYYLDAADTYRLLVSEMADGVDTKRSTQLFVVPVGAVSKVAAGDDVRFQVYLYHDNGGGGGTANISTYYTIYKVDGNTGAKTRVDGSQVISITSDQIKVVSFTWDVALSDGDMLCFIFGRNSQSGSVVVNGADSADDTLNDGLGVFNIRFSTVAPSGS